MIAKVRICTAADRKTVVDSNDKRAAFLLFGVGVTVTEEDRKKFNIPDEMLDGAKPAKKAASGPVQIETRTKRVPDVPSSR